MVDITVFSNPNGLGHVTRNFAITQHLSGISTKFVSAKGAAQYLREVGVTVEETIECPKLDVQNGRLMNQTKWLWKFYKYYKECKEIALRVIEEENPRLVLSDEDYAALDVAQKKKISSIAITNALDLRFTKGFGRLIEKKMDKGMQDILKKCDVVIVPLKGTDHDNLRYVGPIVRTINETREELRQKFSFTKKTIVVSVGGTDAGSFLIEKTVEALSKIEDDVELVIVSGPLVNKDFGKTLRNLGFVNNLHEIIFAADLIICLAGSSTVSESKTYGTPGIFIPVKGHFEQEDNAKREGFSYDDLERLDSLILQKLDEKRNPQKNEGAKIAAEIIKKYVS